MKKFDFGNFLDILIIGLVLWMILSGCQAEYPVKEESVSWENQVAYAYYEVRNRTNNMGGIIGRDTFLILGVIKHNGEVVRYEYYENQIPKISLGEENKIVFHVTRYTYESGRIRDSDAWKEIFLTKEMLSEIGKTKE